MNQTHKLAIASALAMMFIAFAVDFDPADDDLLARSVASVLAEKADGDMTRVTKKPMKMEAPVAQLCMAGFPQQHNLHSDKYFHVYSNELGLETLKAGKGDYPIGSVIVKQKYSDADGKTTELFTVMRKMKDGYDADNGNWEYSVLNKNATTVLSRGRTDSCIACHEDYSSTDYVTRTYLQ